jgi:retinol dehydrogenase 12
LAKETRLDILWNNAGVMAPPAGSKSAQGYELQLGTNCLGPFLLTQQLLPILRQTAASSTPNSVRVLFTASLVAELSTPKGGINFDDINHQKSGNQSVAYGQSKVGNIFLGKEFARRDEKAGNGILFAVSSPLVCRFETDMSML